MIAIRKIREHAALALLLAVLTFLPALAQAAQEAPSGAGNVETVTIVSAAGRTSFTVETAATREQVFAVVDAAFAQRRKTLRASLKGIAGTGEIAEEALRAAGIDPRTRGEQIGVADFARVTEELMARVTA